MRSERKLTKTKVQLYLFMLFLFSENCFAAFSNYNSLPIGDQAAGMGGAYTALTEDCAALAFYNPAGFAKQKNASLSASVNVYKKFDTQFGKVDDLSQAALRMNKGFFQPIPSASGSVLEYNKFISALSIIVPDYDYYNGEIPSNNGSVSVLNYVDESLWVGSALAYPLTEKDSVGATVYYTARNYAQKVTDKFFPTTNEAEILSEEKVINHNAVVVILGYHRDLDENYKVGISYRLKSHNVHGKGSFYRSYLQTTPYKSDELNMPEIDAKSPIPSRLNIGLAYEQLHKFTISADFSVYGEEKYTDFENESISDRMNHRTIFNGAIGVEYYFFPWLKARMGGFTNFSALPKPDEDYPYREGDKIDYLGFSANASIISDKKIAYTFGGYYIGGKGYSKQRVNQKYEVISKTQQVFTMLVSTSFLF